MHVIKTNKHLSMYGGSYGDILDQIFKRSTDKQNRQKVEIAFTKEELEKVDFTVEIDEIFLNEDLLMHK